MLKRHEVKYIESFQPNMNSVHYANESFGVFCCFLEDPEAEPTEQPDGLIVHRASGYSMKPFGEFLNPPDQELYTNDDSPGVKWHIHHQG